MIFGWHVVLAFFWGIFLALFLQFSELGQFLATKQTWISVLIGVAGNLGVAYFFIPWEAWIVVTAVFSASAVGVVSRSLINQHKNEKEIGDKLWEGIYGESD